MPTTEIAGLRKQRKARSTGTLVGLYDGEAAGMDTAGGRWQTVCEEHGWIISHETYSLAKHWMPAPEQWCEMCQADHHQPTTTEESTVTTTTDRPRNMTPDQVAEHLRTSSVLGATRMYPQDRYPLRVVSATASGKTITYVRVRSVDATTGHQPARFDGPWPIWDHEYTPEELTEYSQMESGTRTARWSDRLRCYQDSGTPIMVGVASLYRNYSF